MPLSDRVDPLATSNTGFTMAAFNSTLTEPEAHDGSAAPAARRHQPQIAELRPDEAAEARRCLANLDTASELAASGLPIFPAVVEPRGDGRSSAHDLLDSDDQHKSQQQAASCSRGPQPEFRRTDGYANGAEIGHAFTDGLDPTQCGAWAISGKHGSIGTWGDGETWSLFVACRSAQHWTWTKKKLSFCSVTQDGE